MHSHIVVAMNHCSNGEKRIEGVRRSSPKGTRSFSAARGFGERCKLPQRVRAETASKRHLVHFWS